MYITPTTAPFLSSPPTPSERCEKEELQAQLCDAQEECGLLGMEVGELRSKVETLTDECQERSDQANEWYRSLQV